MIGAEAMIRLDVRRSDLQLPRARQQPRGLDSDQPGLNGKLLN
jgi:hypothetical protein